MPRPQKNNAEYYPHYTTMRNHRKVKALRNKFGSVLGYAFWSMIIEWLSEQDGLEWEDSEIELEMFASELGVSATEIRSLLDFCLKIELLFKNESGFIYSDSLNENLKSVFEKRKRERSKSKTRERRVNGTFNSMTDGVSATEIPQSKVKYSKVKKIKEFVPPSLEEVVSFFQEKGYKTEVAQQAFNGYALADWHDAQGKPVRNWKQKMNNSWFKPENKAQEIKKQMVY